MSGPIRTEALIHDLAIILRGCLHPSAEIGPAPRLAANRIRDVLGVTPEELTAGVEDKLTAALGSGGEWLAAGSSLPFPATVTRGDTIRTVADRGPERVMLVSHVEHHVITLSDPPDSNGQAG